MRTIFPFFLTFSLLLVAGCPEEEPPPEENAESEQYDINIPPFSTTLVVSDGGITPDDGGVQKNNTMGAFGGAQDLTCGDDYEGCGYGGVNDPFACCHKEKEVCFKRQFNKKIPFIGRVIVNAARCSPKSLDACRLYGKDAKWQLCKGVSDDRNLCCKAAPAEKCGQTKGNINTKGGFAYCARACPAGTKKCPETGGTLQHPNLSYDCCLRGLDICKKVPPSISEFYACSYGANDCKADETHCPGTAFNRCCPKGTLCSVGGGGNPNCIPKTFTKGDTDGTDGVPETADAGATDGAGESMDSGSSDGANMAVDAGGSDGSGTTTDAGNADGTGVPADAGSTDGSSTAPDAGNNGNGGTEIDSGNENNNTSPATDGGSSEICENNNGCPNILAGCEPIASTPGWFSVTVDVGTCNDYANADNECSYEFMPYTCSSCPTDGSEDALIAAGC